MSEAAAAEAICAVVARFAPRAVDAPLLQPAGLYLELVGEALRARAFLTQDASGLCLRPDMTVPVLRVALGARAAYLPAAGGALSYDGIVFRRPREPGLEQEFRQVGVEWVGPEAACAGQESALVAAAVEAARAAGVAAHLRLGHLGLVSAAAQAAGFSPRWTARLLKGFARLDGAAAALEAAERARAAQAGGLAEALAALAPADAERVVAELLNAAGLAPAAGRSPALMAARLQAKGAAGADPAPSPQALEHLRALLELDAPMPEALRRLTAWDAGRHPGFGAELARLEAHWAALQALPGGAPPTRFALGFGRGLAYYDGLVFELEAPALGPRANLGGGGRYQSLLTALGGSDFSGWGAAGFALRPGRLAEAGGRA